MSFALDETDLRIIRLLQGDGRMSNMDVARNLGMSEATVRKRADRLISEKAIRVVALPDLPTVGYPLVAIISLQVDLAQVGQIGRSLASLPDVRWLACGTGGSDIVFEAAFPDAAQLWSTVFLALPAPGRKMR